MGRIIQSGNDPRKSPADLFVGGGSCLIISLFCLAGFVFFRLLNPVPAEILRDIGVGLVQPFSSTTAAGAKIVVVDVDDASIALLRKWPLPRETLASLIDKMAPAKPRAIGLGFVFVEPRSANQTSNSTTSPNGSARPDIAPLGQVNGDEILAQSFIGRPIVLGTAAVKFNAGSTRIFPLKHTLVTDNVRVIDALPPVEALTPILGILADSSTGVGILSIQLSHGGVPRRLPSFVSYKNTPVPSLPIEMLRVGAGASDVTLSSSQFGVKAIQVGRTRIDTDINGMIWYSTRPSPRITRITAATLLESEIDYSTFRGSYVLVGSTASGLSSSYISGDGTLLPGLDALSLALAALLDKSWLSYPIISLFIELVLGAVLIGVFGLFAVRRNASSCFLFIVFCVVLAWGISIFFVVQNNQIVDATLITVFLIATYVLLFAEKYRLSRLASGKIISAKELEIDALRRRSAQASVVSANARFSATLSHELRQPLATLRNYLGAITRLAGRSAAPAGNELVDYAEEAKRQVRSMSDIMREVHEVVREDLTQTVEPEIDRIVMDAVTSVVKGIANGQVKVATNFQPNLPVAVINRQQIQQVVKNLVKNAIEAPRETSPLEIRVSIFPTDNKFIRISVRDNAGGIPDAVRKDLFVPFVSSKEGGSGIGLGLCRDIIEAHGGNLWFESEPKTGTEFFFTIPCT